MPYTDDRSRETLILDHLPDIVTLCNRMFGQISDAEDATHEAVIAILKALPAYRGDGPVRHWLLKVALNAARHHRRGLGRKTRRENIMTEIPASEGECPIDATEQQEALRSAITELPEELREPVVLHYYHKLTQAEIGGMLGCSQKTVHQRLRKGVDRLQRRLANSALFGAATVTTLLAGASVDPVSAAITASVKNCIATTLSTATTTTSAALAAPTAVSEVLLTSAITGGIAMKTKMTVVAITLAIASFLGGAALSERIFGPEIVDRSSEIDDLTARLDAERDRLAGLQAEFDEERSQTVTRVAELSAAISDLQASLAEKERTIATLHQEARSLASEVAGDASELSREERWEKIQGLLAGALEILQKMQEKGANQFALGPRLVAELGKLTPEQLEEILAFDETETDPEILGAINAVMLQAFIFVPRAAEYKGEYMSRYLERAQDGSFGESYTHGALRRISFSMPPFVDAYERLVAPLDENLREQYLELALERAANPTSASLRMDGASYLARVPDTRAADGLMRLYEQSGNDPGLRAKAIAGLSHRADTRVLQFLQSYENAEQDPAVAQQIKDAITRVDQLIDG